MIVWENTHDFSGRDTVQQVRHHVYITMYVNRFIQEKCEQLIDYFEGDYYDLSPWNYYE